MASSKLRFLSQGVTAATQNSTFSREETGGFGAGARVGASANADAPATPMTAAAPKVPKNVLRVVSLMASPRIARKSKTAGSKMQTIIGVPPGVCYHLRPNAGECGKRIRL